MVTRQGAGQRMIEEGGGGLREALLQPYPGTEIVRYTLPPLTRTNAFPAHEPGTREGFVVISGQIEVFSGDINVLLSTGDAMAVPVDCAHYVANPGTLEAVYLLLIGRPR